MKHQSKLISAIIVLLVICVIACRKNSLSQFNETKESTFLQNRQPSDPGFADNDMVLYWNEKAANILGEHTNPGADARNFAIIHIAVHDALNSIKPKFQRYALQNEKVQFASPKAAVASAAYWAIKELNIQKTFPIDTWYNESLASIPEGDSKDLGVTLGKKAADAIIADRADDGLSQVLLVSPLPADGVNAGGYRSTLPVSNPDLNLPHLRNVPNWGTVMRPFVTLNNYQFRAPGPYAINSLEYLADYNEVKNKGAMAGATRTAEEEQLARFWSDLKHHIVWNNFTRKVLETKNTDAWKTARLFALIHTTMADAASAMFEAKFHYYFWRPETAVRIADDGNPLTVSDPGWLPNIAVRIQPNPALNAYTPGVPEYPSSFGILGAAAGKILQSFFGTDQISIDMVSAMSPGVVIHYNSISKAVRDNSISKIFAGWYFRKASVDGEEQGKQIATWVYNNSFQDSE